MPIRMIGLLRKPEIVHDLPTHKAFEGEGGEHVEAEAETGDLDDDVAGGGKVVEDVAFCGGPKGEEAGEGHDEAGDEGGGGAVVGYKGEAVDGGLFEGAVD
jgi:hypothetical protein